MTGEKKAPLYAKMSERICRYIEEKGLRPGDRLPGERSLAALWGVGRPSVREAIRELEYRGILQSKVGKGTYVADPEEGRELRIRLVSRNFLELFEIKTALERYCLERIVPRIEDQQIGHLEALAGRMMALAGEGIMPEELDLEFHDYLLLCYGNQELHRMVMHMIAMYQSMTEEMQEYLDGLKYDYLAVLLATIPCHQDMVCRMRERDVAGVLAAYDKITEGDLKIYRRFP